MFKINTLPYLTLNEILSLQVLYSNLSFDKKLYDARGFTWPLNYQYKIETNKEKESKLIGLLRGCGDTSILQYSKDKIDIATWVLFASPIDKIIDKGNYIEAEEGRIVFAGDQAEALSILNEIYPKTPIVYKYKEGVYNDQVIVGDYGCISALTECTAIGGKFSEIFITGGKCKVYVDDNSIVKSGKNDKIYAGMNCTIETKNYTDVYADDNCSISIEDHCNVVCKNNCSITYKNNEEYSFVKCSITAGENCDILAPMESVVFCDGSSKVKAGYNSVINFKYFDAKEMINKIHTLSIKDNNYQYYTVKNNKISYVEEQENI